MEVTFWGVRGSIPSPGPGTVRYGGNTACVSVRLASGELVILDLGTGARNLGNALMEGPFGKGKGRATILLSLAQWDHIQGFPFFVPFYVPGNQFTIYGGPRQRAELEGILERQMAAQYFPVQTYKNMAAQLSLASLPEGDTLVLGSATVRAAREGGPLGATVYRIEEGGRSLAYAGHGACADRGDGRRSLLAGVDLLIHEASFSVDDGRRYPDRGLSSVDQAVTCAVEAGAKTLALFHYDQDYTDAEVDALANEGKRLASGGLRVVAAAERQRFTL
ncbi:MAG: MBL fold metallo-hydrolase [Myxococcales bacterium]|nr:MBL fold metallo-hydrolase [Myxococcales bacterium]